MERGRICRSGSIGQCRQHVETANAGTLISPGHTLIIARRPVSRFQELTSAEKARLPVWIDWTQQNLASHLNATPDAFNLGLNAGPAAGQTMPQLHFDVIPSKARYWQQAAGAPWPPHSSLASPSLMHGTNPNLTAPPSANCVNRMPSPARRSRCGVSICFCL
jgi:diadenosine tetraphosphate (Ap4A) HIT family hydrolase